ncbi:Prefoldin subunit 4 [Candidozyma auris]|uniref:Prefoldin subunit 4 n=2 Tax=Candidozyma auris TaxID=498019 RepID=A0A8F3AIG4_CANAR|nr:hypothetical protein CA7LBN_004217 [[Candida] auris]
MLSVVEIDFNGFGNIKLNFDRLSSLILLSRYYTMELLPSGQQNSVEVLWEDQQKINKFSSLIYKKDALTERLEKLKSEKEYIEDLAMEIELLDEDEKIQYKIGDAFVFLKAEAAIEAINKQNETLDTQIFELKDQIEVIEDHLASYKKDLYAKFGNNIQLER